MNTNSVKYENLDDYSSVLKRTLKSFNLSLNAMMCVPSKKVRSFNISTENLETILGNILETQNLLSRMKLLTSLDGIAKKENKQAQKVGDQLNDIKVDLNKNIDRLKKQYFKQQEICYRQCKKIRDSITNKDDRIKFDEKAKDFNLMMIESKDKIPFGVLSYSEELKIQDAKELHKEKEQRINNVHHFTEDHLANQLQKDLEFLDSILYTAPSNLKTKIRKEVKEIRKALPTKTIFVTKDSLNKLRHSEHLLLDLEQINEVLKTPYCYQGKEGRLQKINKKLDKLKGSIVEAISVEREKNFDLEKKEIKSKVDYAARAVHSYSAAVKKKSNELPIEYTNMKKKLQDMSLLHKFGYSKNGGRFR